MSGVLWIWMVIFRLRFMFVSAEDYGVISNHLRFSARHDDLHDAPSCQHRIIRVELRNVVCKIRDADIDCMFLMIASRKTSPEAISLVVTPQSE